MWHLYHLSSRAALGVVLLSAFTLVVTRAEAQFDGRYDPFNSNNNAGVSIQTPFRVPGRIPETQSTLSTSPTQRQPAPPQRPIRMGETLGQSVPGSISPTQTRQAPRNQWTFTPANGGTGQPQQYQPQQQPRWMTYQQALQQPQQQPRGMTNQQPQQYQRQYQPPPQTRGATYQQGQPQRQYRPR